MVAFIDQHRVTYGVESICAVLPIAPSTYFRHQVQQRAPATRSARARRDEELRAAIQRIWDANHQGVWPAQSLETVATRGAPRGPLHGGTLDARHGVTWRQPRTRVG